MFFRSIAVPKAAQDRGADTSVISKLNGNLAQKLLTPMVHIIHGCFESPVVCESPDFH